MEMESERARTASNEAISKKLLKLVRVVLVMMKRGLTKSKHLVDVALLLKRSHKLAGKTLHSILLSSSSNDAVRRAHDYEFSCSSSSSSPAFSFLKRGKPSPSLLSFSRSHSGPQLNEAHTMAAVQRVLEMINPDEDFPVAADSPAVAVPGWSRQLRITDSPFPVKENAEEAVQVNIAADDFINKFYSNLRIQKSSAVDSPCHDAWAS